ncbi:MAG: hypothetical protein KDC61_19900 [Saprospiraceae bacterium]|nr:hypothetical protein [Saprospiraceae bacterium]
MNAANNVNIDLRPGTRLVRETRGGREVMWVEDDTIFGTSGSGAWFWIMMLAALLFIFGPSVFNDKKDRSGKGSSEALTQVDTKQHSTHVTYTGADEIEE